MNSTFITSYERDIEIDLDFAQARYYAKNHGRFTTTDPLMASAKPLSPQTWNRFSYVINNPLKYIDPTGKCTAPSGLKPGQVGICIEAFIKAPRINNFGHGDNRDHNGDTPNLSARARISFIVSEDTKFIHTEVTERTIAKSSASVPLAGGVYTGDGGSGLASSPEIPLGSYQGSGNLSANFVSTDAKQGTAGFGNSTIVNASIEGAENGVLATGKDLQEGAFVARQVGKVMEAVAPPGTIDVSAQIQISGSGDNINVSATAQSRPYPSVTGYAYIGNADGSVRRVDLFRQNEAKPEDLTKPMRPIP